MMIGGINQITFSVRDLEQSLYFLDPNGHKLEIHASDLETRIKTAKENPWAEIEFFG